MACNDGCFEQNTGCQDCPPECNCTSNDVVYNGSDDTCTGVKYNSKLTEVLTKIVTFAKNKIFSIVGSKSIKATEIISNCTKSVGLEVVISNDSDNKLSIRNNGLYASGSSEYIPDYKVKVDTDDTPDFLEAQITGAENGVVKVDVANTNGLLTVTPTLDIDALLDQIKITYGDKFCELVASCINYTWVADTYACESADLDLIVNKSITGLPNPVYSFEDGGRVYFVSGANNIGKIWSLDPNTANTVSDIVYLKETRNGQPYGTNGGTYSSTDNYKANSATGSGSSLLFRPYYDKPTRTLYVHSGRSNGCDYYDFVSATWGKISVGTTGSAYNTTVSNDYYTHIDLSSNPTTDIIVTGWGTSSANRGANVITISKSSKSIIAEILTDGSTTFTGITGNPFNRAWGAFITSDNRLFVAKSNVSAYRNIAVFNPNLTPIIEIVVTNAATGFNGDSSYYWQNCFIDVPRNKFYINDFMSRTLEVYDTTNYGLLKIFHFDNNRTFSTAAVQLDVNALTMEMYADIIYGGVSASISDDAPLSELVSYKIDRSTLNIDKIYIGASKANALVALSNGDVISTVSGDINPTTPTSTGVSTFYKKNTNTLKNGIIDILTLKEVNASNNVPTGNTKPNLTSNSDYIAPHTDTTLCPVNYTLNAPSSVVATVTPTRYNIEFGLNDDVILNPDLAKITATFVKGSTTVATVTWNVPNTPNRNAFFKSGITSGLSVGDAVTINLQYLNVSNTPIATYNAIRVLSVVAD